MTRQLTFKFYSGSKHVMLNLYYNVHAVKTSTTSPISCATFNITIETCFATHKNCNAETRHNTTKTELEMKTQYVEWSDMFTCFIVTGFWVG